MRTLLVALFWLILIAGGLLGALYVLLFDVWVVPSDDPLLSASIEPTLSAGDVVVLSRRTSVGYGNLLRCADPQAPGRYVIARAIGHSDDKVSIDEELVSVDGKRDPSPRACAVARQALRDPNTGDNVDLLCSVEDFGGVEFGALRAATHPVPSTTVTVEQGRWYLVSDDRHLHVDSRDYGPIDASTCKHIVFRIFGASRVGDSSSPFTIIW